MRQGASSISFCEPLNPAFTKTAGRSLPKLEVMPQYSALDLTRKAACQLEPILCTTNPGLHQKLISLLSAANFFLTGTIDGNQKCSGKSAPSPPSFSALLLCQVHFGRNHQLASAKPFLAAQKHF